MENPIVSSLTIDKMKPRMVGKAAQRGIVYVCGITLGFLAYYAWQFQACLQYTTVGGPSPPFSVIVQHWAIHTES